MGLEVQKVKTGRLDVIVREESDGKITRGTMTITGPWQLTVTYHTGLKQYDGLINAKLGYSTHSAGTYMPLSMRELIYAFPSEDEVNVAQAIVLRLMDEIESITAEVSNTEQ